MTSIFTATPRTGPSPSPGSAGEAPSGVPFYDVVIVGAGAGGGMAAKVLADAGVRTALLEAGPAGVLPATSRHDWPHESEDRGLGIAAARHGDADQPLFKWSDAEPYATAPGSPGFVWCRARGVGGRTNFYGRISPRFSAYDLDGRSRDGHGADWPIAYRELAAYYDRVERLIGVFGTREGLESAPDGIFLPPPAPRCVDLMIQRACRRLGIPCIPARLATLTRPLNGRPASHYCGRMECDAVRGSTFTATRVLIEPALATGSLTLVPNAMAREVETGEDGRVRAILYVDRASREERRIRCGTAVLAASACETARLLLNSKSRSFPDGLANSSGQVGRNLTDTAGLSLRAQIPALAGLAPHDHEGTGALHMFCPWWLHQAQRRLPFPRGYHIELGGGPSLPNCELIAARARGLAGYGSDLKRRFRETWGSRIFLSTRGEMVANAGTYCDLDPDQVDAWGIPVLRFHWRWGAEERAMEAHMRKTLHDVVSALGGTTAVGDPANGELMPPGGNVHELGTARMGADPGDSVVDASGRAHDVANLWIADGAVFPSNPEKNPTLTILALAWRTADHLLAALRAGGAR